MLTRQNAAPKYGDVSRRTLRVIDIIASWTVNTFYNYLHEEAVMRHSQGRAGSITDGYRQMMKAYLDTFAYRDGYCKIVISLHKYYCDAENQAMLALDEWIREILGEFIPDDYKSIMTNNQRYDLLRNILINAIEQFSSVVAYTPMFEILISNHDEPSLVPQMKESMRGMLLAERQNMFMRIHRASTNTDPSASTAGSSMKAEIYRLAEENVLLKSKNGKLVAQVKKAIDGMKVRDRVINTLNTDFRKSQEKIMQLQAQLANVTQTGFSNVAAALPEPKMPADDFKSSLDNVAYSSGFPVLHSKMSKMEESNNVSRDATMVASREIVNPGTRVSRSIIEKSRGIPLTHVEDEPESFTMADPIEDGIAEVDTSELRMSDREVLGQSRPQNDDRSVVTGSDTLALNMDEFMNS